MIIKTPNVLSAATRQYLYDWLDGAANSCLENDPGVGIFPNSDMADEVSAFRSSLLDDPHPTMKAVCETCGENCTHPHHHTMTAVPVEPPISAEFKAARNTLKFLRYTWTGGEHWRPPLGLPPESVTGIDYKKLVEEIAHIVFGNLEHVENLPVAIRATVGRFRS